MSKPEKGFSNISYAEIYIKDFANLYTLKFYSLSNYLLH